jgi:UDP-N-acetylmuramoyl-tripeptide--D-alanyl-D-alanine ligase
VGVQGHAADFVAAAIQAGHPKDRTAFFDNSAEAGKFLSKFVRSGDLVLLKGSRGVRMEKILELISADHRRSDRNLGLQPVDAGREGRN